VDTPECSKTMLNAALTVIPKQTKRTLVGCGKSRFQVKSLPSAAKAVMILDWLRTA
jgi:hypothetical protein